MNIRSRLEKLEKIIKPDQVPLLMIKFDGTWTPQQQCQFDTAKAEKRDIIFVEFVSP